MHVIIPQKILVRYTDKYKANNLPKIEQIKINDWIDLYTAKDVYIRHDEHLLIPLGVSMQLPKGYEAHLAARSSLFKNYGLILTNGVGVIDESYCGDNDEWMASVLCLKNQNHTDGYQYIPVGSRLVQFRIMRKQPEIEFIEVDSLNNPDRHGFGSTGR